MLPTGSSLKRVFKHSPKESFQSSETGSGLKRVHLTASCLKRVHLTGSCLKRVCLIESHLKRVSLKGSYLNRCINDVRCKTIILGQSF